MVRAARGRPRAAYSNVVTHQQLWGHALLLGAVVLTAGIGHHAPRVLGTALAALSVSWLASNGAFEQGVLWVPSHGHGLTVTDFAGLGGLVVAGYLWLLGIRRALRRREL